MKQFWLSALLAIVATTASAGVDSFRCGSDLVSKGDRPSRVITLCGQPSDVTQTAIWRTPVLWYMGRRPIYGEGLIEVPVEVWTYNTGPNNLMRELRFVGGALESVKSLGYGYRAR